MAENIKKAFLRFENHQNLLQVLKPKTAIKALEYFKNPSYQSIQLGLRFVEKHKSKLGGYSTELRLLAKANYEYGSFEQWGILDAMEKLEDLGLVHVLPVEQLQLAKYAILVAEEKLKLRFDASEPLPQLVEHLPTITSIRLRGGWAEIPFFVLNIQNLKELDCKGNVIVQIPESIKKLQQLRLLDLRKNQLSKIPDTICDLTTLESFSFGDNPPLFEKLTTENVFNLIPKELIHDQKIKFIQPSAFGIEQILGSSLQQ